MNCTATAAASMSTSVTIRAGMPCAAAAVAPAIAAQLGMRHHRGLNDRAGQRAVDRVEIAHGRSPNSVSASSSDSTRIAVMRCTG